MCVGKGRAGGLESLPRAQFYLRTLLLCDFQNVRDLCSYAIAQRIRKAQVRKMSRFSKNTNFGRQNLILCIVIYSEFVLRFLNLPRITYAILKIFCFANFLIIAIIEKYYEIFDVPKNYRVF